MKRNHHHANRESFSSGGSSSSSGKAKMWFGDGVDELFAVLVYNLKCSDMVVVALKMEHLEKVMGSVQQDRLLQLASKTVHYNPLDISSWLESMTSRLNPGPEFDSSPDLFCGGAFNV